MKASELIEELQAQIAREGDREVTFYCDHELPPNLGSRPVELVGWGFSNAGKFIHLSHSPEWKARAMARHQTEREHIEAEIEAHKPKGFFGKLFNL